MKTVPKSLRLKSKNDKTSYPVELTGEQIALTRSLYLRLTQLWLHNGVGEIVRENGFVDRVPLYECFFCHKGAYNDASAIPHDRDCIVVSADAEWGKMNAKFIAALNGDSDADPGREA